jgi:hypothetical protein
VLIDWTADFDRWLHTTAGQAIAPLARVDAAFRVLEDLTAEPVQATPTLKRVSQSRPNLLWWISPPDTPRPTIGLIIWFPPERPGHVVVLFGTDTAIPTGTLYDRARSRAAAAINSHTTTTEPGPMTEHTATEHTGNQQTGNQHTGFVGTDAAARKIAKIRAIAGVAQAADQVHAEMVEVDRNHAAGLAAIRKAAELTQADLTQHLTEQLDQHLGVTQSAVSQLQPEHERQPDMLLSTLAGYLTAVGDHPRVVVTISGRDVALDLTTLTTA